MSFEQPLTDHNRHTKRSLLCPHTGLRIPLVPRGLRGALIDLYRATTKCHEGRDFDFFRKKLRVEEIGVMIRDSFVVNRDMKVTIVHDKKLTNRVCVCVCVFFRSSGMALKNPG